MYRQFKMAVSEGGFGGFSDPEYRLVVVGKSGSGKSSTVNLLLGEDLCKVSHYGESLTTDAKMFSRPRFGTDVRVVDTPGLFDSRPDMTNEKVLQKLASTALLLAPGPHAILLTIALGQRFTAEEKAVIEHLSDFFGKEALRHTIVVFTRGDELKKTGINIEEYVRNAPADLKSLLNEVNLRYVAITNDTASARDESAKSLLTLVEKTVSHAGSPFYNSELFTRAENEMSLLDDAVRREFLPRQDSTSSLSDSMLQEEIGSIVNTDSGIELQTNLPRASEMEGQDKNEMTMLATRLVRLVTRNKVSDGKEPDAVQNLIRSQALPGMLPPPSKESPDTGSEVKGKYKK